MSESIRVKLSKPIQAHGEEVREITLRPPLAKDVMEIGSPQLLLPGSDGASVAIEVRAKLIGQYIVRLAGIPLSSVQSMDLPDFMRCQGEIMGFFGNGAETETESSSSPASST